MGAVNLDIVVYGNVTLFDLILVIMIFIIAFIIGKIISINLRRALKEKVSKEHQRSIGKVVYVVLIIIAFMAVLPILGVDPSGIVIAAGFLGLVIGLASQSILGNLIAGLFLVVERPLKVGDQVEVEGVTGYVEDVRIMSTVIRTYEGVFVRIPNETIFTSKIANLVAHPARRVEWVVGIRYRDDADKAVSVIKQVISEHPFTLVKPKPEVFVKELANSSVDIMVRVWLPSTEWYPVRQELLWRIKVALEDNDIFVPFPQREVWFNSELRTKALEGESAPPAR